MNTASPTMADGKSDRGGGKPTDDEIVMVPVPRSRLEDVYRALGRPTNGQRDSASWEPAAIGLLRGSAWIAREVVRPAAQDIARQDPEEIAAAVGGLIRRAAQAAFEPDEDPDGPKGPA
jgi:hypothetical protein